MPEANQAPPADIPADALGLVRALAHEASSGYRFSFAPGGGPGCHAHAHGQLVFAPTDLVTVEAAGRLWLASPHHAVWIPPDVPHEVRSAGGRDMCSLYIAPRRARNLTDRPMALGVSCLLKKLILRLSRTVSIEAPAVRRRLLGVALDEVGRSIVADPQPHLSVPTAFRDPRLRPIAQALAANPLDEWSLDDWARALGMSRRTLTRSVRSETGLSWREWRLRLRMAEAVRRLTAGAAVKAVAFDLGYAGSTSFIAAFAQMFGATPGWTVRHSRV